MKLKCRNCKTTLNKETQVKKGFCCTSCKETYRKKKGGSTWLADLLFAILEFIAYIIP